jgi:hypothetical protein
MRQSVVLLICALVGVLLGGWLIGRWALGVCVIFDSLCVGVFALVRDDGEGVPQVHGVVPTLAQVLERARAS